MAASNNSLLGDPSAGLAYELALGLRPPLAVAADYGVDEAGLRALLDNPRFADMVREARKEWESAHNTAARIRIKARMAVEESLPTLFDVVQDPAVAGAARVNAFRELREIADVAAPPNVPAPGSSLPPITIVFNGAPTGVTIHGRQPLDEKPAIPSEPDL
jgi:hypothetical protein